MQSKSSQDLLGLDISSYQTIENPDKFFYGSQAFNIFRAYGSNHQTIDSQFVANVQKAKTKGVKSGAYYFGTPKATSDIVGHAQEQAQQFITALYSAYGEGNTGDITPFLDVEEYKDVTTGQAAMPMSSGMTSQQFITWIKAFRDYFFSKTKRRLGFYSNRWFLTDKIQMNCSQYQLQELSNMPFWLAEYDQWYGGIQKNNTPLDLGGWDRWVLWQYAVLTNGDVYGLVGSDNQVDHNRCSDISWLLPPPAIDDFTLINLGNGTLRIDIEAHPTVTDYLGANVYINNEWFAWVSKNQTSISLSGLQRGTPLQVKIVTEDYYHDFTDSKVQIITL